VIGNWILNAGYQLDLPLKEKARSVVGTWKRIIQRKYYRPLEYK
jgi:hypothetical protein